MQSSLIIPNIFSPDGNGENDFFEIKEDVNRVNIESIEVHIYNRWGHTMSSWSSLNGKWDGTTPNGEEANEGTYYYVITSLGFDGQKYLKKGSFTLVRLR